MFVIMRNEALSKPTVGTFIKKFAAKDLEAAQMLIQAFYMYFDIESMKNATKHFEPQDREKYCALARKRKFNGVCV